MIESHMSECVTCRKNQMLHYVSPIGLSDTRMLPTIHPFSQVSIDPITSWPITILGEKPRKLPVLMVLCRQTGYIWHQILFNWTTQSFTFALMMLQFRYGKIESILSDAGSNFNPARLNPGIHEKDGEQKRLMSVIHTQTPVGGQHLNTVETRIRLVKQYCRNMTNMVKGQRYQPLSITQSNFILAAALNEVNNIPLVKHPKFLFLTPQMLVNPLLQMTTDQLDNRILERYYNNLQPYLQLIKELRFATFVKYTQDKSYLPHNLTRQGNLTAAEGDFVLLRDDRKFFWTSYGIILKMSDNGTRAFVKTKKHPKGTWVPVKLLFPLVRGN